MTADEFFALSSRIHRIESAMITYRSATDPDDPYAEPPSAVSTPSSPTSATNST